MWHDLIKLKNILLGVLVLVLMHLCTSCGTTKYVPKYVYVTDTTKNSSRDTLLNERFVKAYEELLKFQQQSKETKIKETTHVQDSVSPIYDKDGKKTGENKTHIVIKTVESSEVSSLKETIDHLKVYKDSTAIYKHQVDSLANIKNKEVPYYIDKKLNVFQKALIVMGVVFLTILFIYFCAVIKNIIKKIRAKN